MRSADRRFQEKASRSKGCQGNPGSGPGMKASGASGRGLAMVAVVGRVSSPAPEEGRARFPQVRVRAEGRVSQDREIPLDRRACRNRLPGGTGAICVQRSARGGVQRRGPSHIKTRLPGR